MREKLVSRFVAVTFAPAIVAALLSRTVPSTTVVVVCASRSMGRDRKTTRNRREARKRIRASGEVFRVNRFDSKSRLHLYSFPVAMAVLLIECKQTMGGFPRP